MLKLEVAMLNKFNEEFYMKLVLVMIEIFIKLSNVSKVESFWGLSTV